MMSQNITPAGCKFAIEEKPMNLETPKAVLYFLSKLFDYANLGMITLSSIAATGIHELIQLLLKDIPKKDIFLPIVISGITFIVFIFTFTVDFITGIVAAKSESARRSFIKSSRLWSTIWKMVGVCSIMLFLLIFNYVFILLNMSAISLLFEIALPGFMIIVILYEIHSIGENIERRYGKKPKYFNFFEKMAAFFEKAVLDKLQKLTK